MTNILPKTCDINDLGVLYLSLKSGDIIRLGENIFIQVIKEKGKRWKHIIRAPKETKIDRLCVNSANYMD